MHLETIKKRQFAFGLTWVAKHENVREDIQSSLGTAGDVDEAIIYHIAMDHPKAKKAAKGAVPVILETGAEQGVIGYFQAQAKLKIVYSAAAALASRGREGLFVFMLASGDLWYCGVRGGVVLASTDVTGPADTIRSTVATLSGGLDLPIYASFDAGIANAQPLELHEALADAKTPSLRLLNSSFKAIVAVVTVVLLIGLSTGIYQKFFTPKKLTPAQQQALLRTTYVQAVSDAVAQLPADSSWVLKAYSTAVQTLPPYLSGWTLEGIDCKPNLCAATYLTSRDSPFALTPLTTLFGPAAQVVREGDSLEVALPVQVTLREVTEPMLRSVRPATLPLLDWVGLVPLRMGGATIGDQPLQDDLSLKFGAPAAGMPHLVMDEVSLKAASYLDPALLMGITRTGSRGGFVPVQFFFSFGNGNLPATWKMTWMRIHG